jgi:predicted permease
MGTFGRDLGLAVRTLARSPGFTLVAVLTLAVGIGANTAIFSVVNTLLLSPPAHVLEPERVVTLWTSDFSGPPYGASSYPDYETFREQRDVVVDVAAFGLAPGNLVEPDETVRLTLETVSLNYFDVLGVLAERGRTFDVADGDAPAVALISHTLWQSRFGADAAVVGRAIRLNAGTFTVVGVAPEGFDGSTRGLRVDAWVPIQAAASLGGNARFLDERGARRFNLVGRLQPGVSLEQSRARFAVVANQMLAAYPDSWSDVSRRGRVISVLPESASRVPPDLQGAVVGFAALLFVGVTLVLLICCANVANLLLARGAGRAREIAIRLSLGAGRGRLVRQLMAESLLLAAMGCGGAVLLAFAAASALLRFRAPLPIPLTIDVETDVRVLGFAVAVALVAAAVFGLAPALQSTRLDPSQMLKDGAGAVGGARRSRLRSALIVAQVAVSLTLMVSAGLFLRSLQQATAVDLGFDPENVVVASFDLRTQGYTPERSRAFYAELVERAGALPGARGVTLAANVPLSGDGGRNLARVEGYEPRQGEDMEFNSNVVGPEYFEVMRVPLARGRGFSASDREGAPQVAVVNESFAARFWPGGDPLGKRLAFSRVESIEVVGVARDGKYLSPTEAPLPYVYRPFLQEFEEQTLHVRVAGDTAAAIAQLRREIRALDAQLPILGLTTMEAEMAFATLPQRIAATLLGACSLLALLLAAVGLYGVVAYAVSQRTREFGVRIALGASGATVMRDVLLSSLRLVALGLVIGIALAVLAGFAFAPLLGGVGALDPQALLAAPLVLIAAAVLASYIPARRAARIAPMQALRHD